jgi:hypothetical protein
MNHALSQGDPLGSGFHQQQLQTGPIYPVSILENNLTNHKSQVKKLGAFSSNLCRQMLLFMEHA